MPFNKSARIPIASLLEDAPDDGPPRSTSQAYYGDSRSSPPTGTTLSSTAGVVHSAESPQAPMDWTTGSRGPPDTYQSQMGSKSYHILDEQSMSGAPGDIFVHEAGSFIYPSHLDNSEEPAARAAQTSAGMAAAEAERITSSVNPSLGLAEFACVECRRQKLGCDKPQPSCGRCTNLRESCSYESEKPLAYRGVPKRPPKDGSGGSGSEGASKRRAKNHHRSSRGSGSSIR